MATDKLRLQYLFKGFLNDTCTPAEMKEFWQAMSELEEEDILKPELEQLWFNAAADKEKAPPQGWDHTINRIHAASAEWKKQQPSRIRRITRWVAAASIILMLGTGAYIFLNKTEQPIAKTEEPTQRFKNDVAAPTKTKATITLADGRVVSLDSLTSITQGNVNLVKNANGEIVYSGNAGEVAYNTLFNPRGSNVVSLTLGDGTQVWLNSESSLKYPTSFTGNERKVEITGEAYFEVTHNAAKPFKVGLPPTGGGLGGEVEVLGTQFNINAYGDEAVIKTTLLQGSVKVLSANRQRSMVILPGQQAVLTQDSRLTTHASVDLEQVMAWKNGRFQFKSADITILMKQIERWYDVDVNYEGTITKKFSGKIPSSMSAMNILKALEETGGVRFSIDGRKVTVRP